MDLLRHIQGDHDLVVSEQSSHAELLQEHLFAHRRDVRAGVFNHKHETSEGVFPSAERSAL